MKTPCDHNSINSMLKDPFFPVSLLRPVILLLSQVDRGKRIRLIFNFKRLVFLLKLDCLSYGAG